MRVNRSVPERSRYTDVLGWVPLTRSDCPQVGPSYALSTTGSAPGRSSTASTAAGDDPRRPSSADHTSSSEDRQQGQHEQHPAQGDGPRPPPAPRPPCGHGAGRPPPALCGSPVPAPAHTAAAIAPGRRNKQTTPEVQPCRPSPPLPIIGVPALLKLADWSRRRREQPQHGGSSCEAIPPVQPPAPAEAEPTRLIGAPLASPAPVGPTADAPDPQPHRRAAAPKASRRQGGRP